MYAVREQDVRPGDSDRVEVFDVAHARLAHDHLTLRAVLRGVRVNHYAALARETRDAREQLPRATDGEARREAVAYATIGATVPLVKQCERLAYRVLRLLLKTFGHVVAAVHHALADSGAEARLLDDAQDLFGVSDRLHRERARRPAPYQLRDAETGRGAQTARVVRGLHGPHATLEPVNQFEVISRAAEEGLTKMHVRLHEAGQNGAPARVNRQVRRARRVAD